MLFGTDESLLNVLCDNFVSKQSSNKLSELEHVDKPIKPNLDKQIKPNFSQRRAQTNKT